MLLCRLAQCGADKLMQLLQVGFGFFGARQNDREGHVLVVRVHQNPEQVQKLFSRARTAREDDDAVPYTHKRFEAFFDVRQNHQFVNDWVRGFGGDDAGHHGNAQ